MAVRIVTDSTSDLPADVIEQLGITVVAQNVHFGTETFKDNVTITPDTFFSMLASSKELPKTSQASPANSRKSMTSSARAPTASCPSTLRRNSAAHTTPQSKRGN